MGKKLYPSNVLKNAIRVRTHLKTIDEGLAFGDVDLGRLDAAIEGIYKTQHEVISLEHRLIEVRNRRDELYLSAWDQVKRVRAGVKGLYGDDSNEYQLVGGTRRSERKRARRRPATE